jgi:hypothetical protein
LQASKILPLKLNGFGALHCSDELIRLQRIVLFWYTYWLNSELSATSLAFFETDKFDLDENSTEVNPGLPSTYIKSSDSPVDHPII